MKIHQLILTLSAVAAAMTLFAQDPSPTIGPRPTPTPRPSPTIGPRPTPKIMKHVDFVQAPGLEDIDAALPLVTTARHDWHVQPATDRCNFVEMTR